jgi:hypothetical protein
MESTAGVRIVQWVVPDVGVEVDITAEEADLMAWHQGPTDQ